MRAEAYVAESVQRILSQGGKGEILMVNSSGMYLSAEGEVIFICDASWGCVPIGVATEGYLEIVANMAAKSGQAFTFEENTLNFKGGSLHLIPKLPVKKDTCHAKPRPHILYKAAVELIALRKTQGISMLAEPLVLCKHSEKVLALNPYCERAHPLLVRLMQALAEGSVENINSFVEALLGLGTGLTPSADDVLLGMLYVFRKLPEDAPKATTALRNCIWQACDERTNKVSAAYLKAIINGEYFERIEHVWSALCGLRKLDISEITSVGSNSGAEMLLGMLCAARACGYTASLSHGA